MFPQNERERVGATLRTLRRTTRGWKLGDFATQLGISYAYLSNIEAGRKPLPDHLLARAPAPRRRADRDQAPRRGGGLMPTRKTSASPASAPRWRSPTRRATA
jgi:transcriptional regulator with XRE-family HTH domain